MNIESDITESIGISITNHHKTVSNIDTPKYFIKSKGGIDYVEYSYMRDVADKYFPGWSWRIINREHIGDEAYEVHGRLTWFDNGIWRDGDAVASHRVQKKRDGSGFVDIGNDTKAANTDAIKKAFNMFMNIADDVYRNRVEDLTLSKEQVESIMTSAEYIQDSETRDNIRSSLTRGDILKTDYNKVMKRIEIIKKGDNK